MSLLDKLKSILPGSSSAGRDAHAGHDHSTHSHTPDPAPAAPPLDPLGTPAPDTTREDDSPPSQRL